MTETAADVASAVARPSRVLSEEDRARFLACYRGLGNRRAAAFVALASEVDLLDPESPVLAWINEETT